MVGVLENERALAACEARKWIGKFALLLISAWGVARYSEHTIVGNDDFGAIRATPDIPVDVLLDQPFDGYVLLARIGGADLDRRTSTAGMLDDENRTASFLVRRDIFDDYVVRVALVGRERERWFWNERWR